MEHLFSLSLIDNSFDFLDSAIKYSNGKEHRDWKYALLNIANALELITKAVLEKEHWSLLFDHIDQANKDKLSKGDFQSVNFKTAVDRLKSIVGLELTANEEKYLNKIREKRNKIIHFTTEIHIEEVKSIVAKGIGVFIKIYKQIETEENVEDKLFEINAELVGFQRYVNLHLAEIEKEKSNLQIPDNSFLTCLSCLQETIYINEELDVLSCKFCGAEFSYVEMAKYSSNGCGGPCPQCENGALAIFTFGNREEYRCTKCDFNTEVNYNHICGSCSNTYWDETGEDGYICESCHKSMYE